MPDLFSNLSYQKISFLSIMSSIFSITHQTSTTKLIQLKEAMQKFKNQLQMSILSNNILTQRFTQHGIFRQTLIIIDESDSDCESDNKLMRTLLIDDSPILKFSATDRHSANKKGYNLLHEMSVPVTKMHFNYSKKTTFLLLPHLQHKAT